MSYKRRNVKLSYTQRRRTGLKPSHMLHVASKGAVREWKTVDELIRDMPPEEAERLKERIKKLAEEMGSMDPEELMAKQPIAVCPKCEAELRPDNGDEGDGRPPPPKRPKVVDLKPPRRPPSEDSEEKEEDEEEEKKEEKPRRPEEDEEELPLGFKPEDIKKAEKGTEQVQEEFEKVTREEEDKLTPTFMPVASTASPEPYRDKNFITKMNTALREWKIGYKRITGETGARLSIPEYIRRREEPFVTMLKRSAKGRKILVIADFSGSMKGGEEDYKKAILSSMEVLDDIGSETALFGFGGEAGNPSEFFFRVKRFEEPKWKPDHSAKTAALQANYGSTPTWEVYEGLEGYIKKHRPDVTVTITDGAPCGGSRISLDVATQRTAGMVKKLKKNTRMVAFGIADPALVGEMDENLKRFGYHGSFAVGDVKEIPPRLVKLMAGTNG